MLTVRGQGILPRTLAHARHMHSIPGAWEVVQVVTGAARASARPLPARPQQDAFLLGLLATRALQSTTT